MMSKLWAFGLWAAVAASTVAWGLKLLVPVLPVPSQASVATVVASARSDLTRLLGADAVVQPAVVVADARFQLVGVVAAARPSAAGREGVALIATDGKPAKAYRVGAVVDGSTVLQQVSQRGASLGPRDGAAAISLEIPPPEPAATGTLPPAANGSAMAPPPAPARLRLPPRRSGDPPRLPVQSLQPQMPGVEPQQREPSDEPDSSMPAR